MARGNQVVTAAKREIEKLEKQVAKLDEPMSARAVMDDDGDEGPET